LFCLQIVSLARHARACRGHPRLNGQAKDVDGRNKSGHDDASKSSAPIFVCLQIVSLARHARACRGHPRLNGQPKTWMAGTSPAMTITERTC
jgi:hypothetical protein